jgi:hypothetical protein
MFKRLKVIILGISALVAILPAYGQAAVTEQRQTAVAEQSEVAAMVQDEAPVTEQGREGAAEQGKGDPKELNKGLDEQVQEIKTDVLSIAAELNQLQEKLLYPSDTQIAIFVSVAKEEKFRLDAVDIRVDGSSVAHHLYTYKELEALQKGGVQRIYVGNVRTGEHAVQVTVLGKSEGGSDFQQSESFTVSKNVGPKLVGIVLAGSGSKNITLKDW